MASSADTYSAIVAADQMFMNYFSQGDAAGLATLYTENAQFLPANSDFVTGRQAIQSALQALMDMGIKKIKLDTIEVERHGDTAIEVGKYTLSGDASQVLDHGKFIVVWKHEAGQWRMHRDMINSSVTPS